MEEKKYKTEYNYKAGISSVYCEENNEKRYVGSFDSGDDARNYAECLNKKDPCSFKSKDPYYD